MRCAYCNVETYMPFRCPYCGNHYCTEHRLPENHNCPEIWRAKIPPPQTPVRGAYQHTITYAPVISKRAPRFITKELQHITIGTALVMAVGITMMLQFTTNYTAATILGALFTVSFLLHEFAHKLTAQRYDLWAEFRLTLWGALITLISIISPLKLISPGAVMISGSFVDRKIMGKTAIAGPTINIILATIFTTTAFTTINTTIYAITIITAYINAFLATFNLIPFGVIDGRKIFFWNKLAWATIFFAALALTILTAPYAIYAFYQI